MRSNSINRHQPRAWIASPLSLNSFLSLSAIHVWKTKDREDRVTLSARFGAPLGRAATDNQTNKAFGLDACVVTGKWPAGLTQPPRSHFAEEGYDCSAVPEALGDNHILLSH